MTPGLAHAGGPVAAAGLALVIVSPRRDLRLAGLGGWLLGCAFLAAYLAPGGHSKVYAAAVVVGAIGAVAIAALFRRWPWLIAVSALACVPARIPVHVGATDANLLVPLYAVIAGAAVLLGWELVRGDDRTQELGPLAWPLSLLVAWTGLSLLWTKDLHEGAVALLFFWLPFGLLAVSIARLAWNRRWLSVIYVQLVGMALAFAWIGVYQYATRDVFWNPKVIVANAYAPFYRVNSVFYDPSVYGRFLVVAMLAALVLAVYDRDRRAAYASGAAVVLIWPGLLFSFSQSSFAALMVGAAVVAAFRWRWRAALALGVAAAVIAAIALGTPHIRHSLLRESGSGLNQASSGRAKLVTQGIRIALHNPVEGVGVGGFKRAYADRVGLKGKEPKKAASHNTAVTVAAETGIPGLLLLGWLVFVALFVTLRRAGAAFKGRACLAIAASLAAIGVHSLFYNALFEDPTFWGLLALTAAVRAAAAAPPAARARAGGGAVRAEGEGDDVIESWQRVLVLAPHTDDGEFGCGGTMARLVETGADVRYVAFSIATKSLPEGFPPDTLAREVREATAELGIPEANLTVHDFDVRTFPDHRQDILELLIALWEEWRPDAVFQPSLHDIHQDHQVVAAEGLRAFKRTTILGYEIPWNNFDFAYQWYSALEQSHVERKAAALARYASQQHRRYADPEYIRNVARTHGINVNREYAEVFQVYRVVA